MKDAFNGKVDPSRMSRIGREEAAKVFDQTAAKPGQHELGIKYNQARAKFLRGEGPNPGPNAVAWGKANGVDGPSSK